MNKRVLIVDDDAGVRESMKRVLEAAGYEVVLSADGPEAESQFAPGEIDLVLLDLNLPSQSGWELFEHLSREYPLVRVIIITGMPNQYETALAAGVGALMEKPIEVPELLKSMKALLAEPNEARLQRMCGFLEITEHVSAACANPPWRAHLGSRRHRRPGG